VEKGEIGTTTLLVILGILAIIAIVVLIVLGPGEEEEEVECWIIDRNCEWETEFERLECEYEVDCPTATHFWATGILPTATLEPTDTPEQPTASATREDEETPAPSMTPTQVPTATTAPTATATQPPEGTSTPTATVVITLTRPAPTLEVCLCHQDAVCLCDLWK
jgi:hypothetical protein